MSQLQSFGVYKSREVADLRCDDLRKIFGFARIFIRIHRNEPITFEVIAGGEPGRPSPFQGGVSFVPKKKKRRRKKKGAGQVFLAYALQRHPFCQWCGVRVYLFKKRTNPAHLTATVDHFIPRSKGGTNEWENLLVSCGPCNNKKGDRLPEGEPIGPRWSRG